MGVSQHRHLAAHLPVPLRAVRSDQGSVGTTVKKLTTTVRFIGGKADGLSAEVTSTPKELVVGGDWYERIDDPDTGESLNGYVWRMAIFNKEGYRVGLVQADEGVWRR